MSSFEHAHAACVARFFVCCDLCGRIWKDFDPLDVDEGCRFSRIMQSLSGFTAASASAEVEARSVSDLFHNPSFQKHKRVHLHACRVLGAGAGLTATPVRSRDPHRVLLFRRSFRRRLHIPLWESDFLVRFAGRSVERPRPGCCCGRDGVLRHSAIRDILFSAAPECSASSPELENKASCLFRGHRPLDPCLVFGPSDARRPADIWVSRGSSGVPDAWDVSVSSLLRPSAFASTTPVAASVFAEAETRKYSFQDIASQVAAMGACGF